MSHRTNARDGGRRAYRYYDLLMAAFIAVLLCSDLIGVGKPTSLFGYSFGAGVLFFPLSYLLDDVLTEVYGYALARRVVWAGFGALIFASFMSWVIVRLPAAAGWTQQAAYEGIFGQTPRIVLASLVAFWAGEFVNSFVLAKLKIKTGGRLLWVRTIGSTVVGEGFDSLIFYPVAFLGAPGWTTALVLKVLAANYVIKVVWEIVATPLTYAVVNFLKRAEGEDYFDRQTDFNPFTLET
ncbi:MAG: queuosine precursor transporter [Pyrinomonadaceae bacterium]